MHSLRWGLTLLHNQTAVAQIVAEEHILTSVFVKGGENDNLNHMYHALPVLHHWPSTFLLSGGPRLSSTDRERGPLSWERQQGCESGPESRSLQYDGQTANAATHKAAERLIWADSPAFAYAASSLCENDTKSKVLLNHKPSCLRSTQLEGPAECCGDWQ